MEDKIINIFVLLIGLSFILSVYTSILVWAIWIRPFIKRIIGHSYSGVTWLFSMIIDLEKSWDAAKKSKTYPWFLYLYTITFIYPWVILLIIYILPIFI
jgi:hypothetical protein